jgi:group I intron endonuclease
MKGTVYVIGNLETEKKYIGQTTRELHVRFQEHCGSSNTSVSPLLKNSIKKYGKDYFYMEPLWESDNCTQKELDEKEMELIKEHNTISPNGYNLTEGGAGGRHSAETKQLLSSISKNMWAEKREEMVEKRRSQWTDERRANLSVTLKQRYIDHPEMRIKKKHSAKLPLVSAGLAGGISCL